MQKPVGRARARSGLTLPEAVPGLLLCVLLVVAIQIHGPVAVMVAIHAGVVILGCTVLWALAYLRAPDLTRNGSVLLLLGVLTLAWVPNRLLQMRETARRNGTRNHLRELGQAIRGLEDTGRPGGFEQHIQQYLEMEEAESRMRRAVSEETEKR